MVVDQVFKIHWDANTVCINIRKISDGRSRHMFVSVRRIRENYMIWELDKFRMKKIDRFISKRLI